MHHSLESLHESNPAPSEEASEWYPDEKLEILEGLKERREKSGFGSYVTREREHVQVAKAEKRVEKLSKYEETFNALLSRYGVETRVRKIDTDLFAVPYRKETKKFLNTLPEGFAYMGGAARALLERSLGVNPYSTFRDIDIVAIDERADPTVARALSEEYMPEDAAHGHGIQLETDQYFETRDFTINEVLATGDAIYCTKQCLLDTLRGVVRFTDHAKQESHSKERPYFIHPKLLAKALRFAADRVSMISDPDAYQYQEIDEFHMALHLDRALEQGYASAQAYVAALREHHQVPDAVQTPEDLFEYLDGQTNFVFRFAPNDAIDSEESTLDDLEAQYQDYPLHEGMHKPHSL